MYVCMDKRYGNLRDLVIVDMDGCFSDNYNGLIKRWETNPNKIRRKIKKTKEKAETSYYWIIPPGKRVCQENGKQNEKRGKVAQGG